MNKNYDAELELGIRVIETILDRLQLNQTRARTLSQFLEHRLHSVGYQLDLRQVYSR